MDIPDHIRKHHAEVELLCQQSGVRRLGLFGSAARDAFDPATSDLDFLVEFDEAPPAQYAHAFFTLKRELEALFGRDIDLITESSLANPFFRARVVAELQPLYAR